MDYYIKSCDEAQLPEILEMFKEDYHILVGGIDDDNKISIKFHEKMGFEFAGTIKQAGYKFGKWLDLSFYQLIIKTPVNPTEE